MFSKRKYLFFALSVFLNVFVFAYSYQITDVKYEITGKTKENSLKRNINIDTKTVFEDEESFLKYIADLKQTFFNIRAFEEIEIEYNIDGSYEEILEKVSTTEDFPNEESLPENNENEEPQIEENSTADNEANTDGQILNVTLTIKLKDSMHFLAVPYFKYSTSGGLSVKIKVKDTNFFGTMNTLNSSFDLNWKPDEDGNKFKIIEPKFNFVYDLPFKIGNQNFTWMNNYSISYQWGEKTPEWIAETGIAWIYDLGKLDAKLNIAFIQGFYKNLAYRDYGDDTYLSEKLNISVPMTIFHIGQYGPVKFSPYFNTIFNFDPIYPNGYSGFGYTKNSEWKEKNIDLMGPKVYFGGTFSFDNVNWTGNSRNGISFALNPSMSYNFASISNNDVFKFSLGIEIASAVYKSFEYIGFNARFCAFAFLNDEKNSIAGAKQVAPYLRGIIDNRKVDKNYAEKQNIKIRYEQSETPVALIFNFDMPVHILTTSWETYPITRKIPFMKYFNFELQLSPFFDFALIQTTNERHGYIRTFNPKDGFYTAGLEAIVFPAKWKSLEVRVSAGFDIGTLLYSALLETGWRNKQDQNANWLKTAEIVIGIGLHY